MRARFKDIPAQLPPHLYFVPLDHTVYLGVDAPDFASASDRRGAAGKLGWAGEDEDAQALLGGVGRWECYVLGIGWDSEGGGVGLRMKGIRKVWASEWRTEGRRRRWQAGEAADVTPCA